MIQLTSREINDLKQCMDDLGRVLTTLDTAGAGIAAIHVNAAIEQLKKNLNALSANNDLDPTPLFFPEGND